jgi:polysaccharide export outer membrane protein
MKTILIASVMLVGLAQAQPPRPAPPAEDAYIVGVGDELQLRVFGEEDMSRDRLLIDRDGTIEVHQLGRVQAAGRTVRQIQDFIADELVKRKIFVQRPSVTVRVAVYRSQSIRVEGQVRSPGVIVMEGGLSVADAIYRAQGFTNDAGSVIHVYRARPDEAPAAGDSRKPDLEVMREDLESGRASAVRLQDGDRVHVPRASTFKITGAVRAPGIYIWRPNLTVWEAVSALGGNLTERGSKGRIQIFRIVNGNRRTINVKKPEEELVLPDDTINVRNRII